jgi:hypothetical protein
MGLDMYAYTGRKGQMNEFYEQDIKFNRETGDWDVPAGGIQKPRELAYWRKHPNLHGWFHKLWAARGGLGDFNGDELELTLEDLDTLETVVEKGRLPSTRGFFFGDDSDQHYKAQDLKFIQDARAEIAAGNCVFYNSSW